MMGTLKILIQNNLKDMLMDLDVVNITLCHTENINISTAHYHQIEIKFQFGLPNYGKRKKIIIYVGQY